MWSKEVLFMMRVPSPPVVLAHYADRNEFVDTRPFAYAAGGVLAVRTRAQNETDPAVLAQYGGGWLFPLYHTGFAENGNYLEPEEIAVRKGVCGDPRIVSAHFL